tara:strand:+ start:7023 stop:7652 length:630 start_codon:yes stop_codon:yes gene_type:complete
MSKINIDLSTKVDLVCREKDDFVLNLDLTNASLGTVFELLDSFIYFTVYNSLNEPIFVVSGKGFADSYIIPVLTNNFIANSGDNVSANLNEAVEHAKALINLINAKEEDLNFTRISDYIIKLGGHIGQEVLIDNLSFLISSNNNFFAGILPTQNGVEIKVKSHRFNLKENTYNYDCRVVSDIRKDESSNDFFFKNSQTFLFGKLKVVKN